MDDRTLLEMAARAAGLGLFVWGKKGSENYCLKLPDGTPGNRWNPLTDDGDALRLAVKLNIEIIPQTAFVWASHPSHRQVIREPSGTDLLAATRRAITRAAASIGAAMAQGGEG